MQYDAKSVLHARHLYVHKGKVIDDNDIQIQMKSIGLALSCLLRYSEAACYFRDKNTLVDYLDFVSNGMRLYEIWNDEEKKAFKVLLKHEQKSHNFPFIKGDSTVSKIEPPRPASDPRQ